MYELRINNVVVSSHYEAIDGLWAFYEAYSRIHIESKIILFDTSFKKTVAKSTKHTRHEIVIEKEMFVHLLESNICNG